MPTRRELLLQTGSVGVIAAASLSKAPDGSHKADSIASKKIGSYRIPRTDLTVSRLAFGCAMVGWDWDSADFASRAAPIIQSAYDQGITLFDLADVYGNGNAEVALGQLLRQSPGLRHRIIVQTKCGDRLRDGSSIDNSREHIIASAEGSLRRLGTDYLDLLLLHWPDSLVQPAEVATAFDALKRSGKVRYFGVSNHSPMQYELLQRYVHQPLVVSQIQLGLMHWYVTPHGYKATLTHADEGVATLDYCRVHDIQVQAYSPLKSDDIWSPPSLLNPPADAGPGVKRAVQLLGEIARKYDASPAAVILAWLLRHPAGIIPIIGATKAEHVEQGCVANRIDLSRIEWYSLLSAVSELQPAKPI